MRRALVFLAALAVGACRAPAPAGGGTELELANWADYREADLENRVLAPFEWSHPGITVQQQSAGTGQAEYRERILTSIAAGHPHRRACGTILEIGTNNDNELSADPVSRHGGDYDVCRHVVAEYL